MNATLARLHNFDPAAIALRITAGRKLRGATDRALVEAIPRVGDGEDEDMERLMAWLPAHLPPPQKPRLVHGDYRLDNIILAPDAPTISAVLDWELSTLGDPLADFSYHSMQWHMPPSEAGTGSLVGFDLAALGIPSLDDYVAAYVRRTGLDPRPYLSVYSAYNFFRLAATWKASLAGRETAQQPAPSPRRRPAGWSPRRQSEGVRTASGGRLRRRRQ